jgi:starch-binding outer membrane protein, SusD/RagB family
MNNMTRLNKISAILGLAGVLIFPGCSLDEELRSNITVDQAQKYIVDQEPDFDILLAAAYNSGSTFMTQDRIWALQEHATDELIPPTRGGDWDDNGDWRQLHAHKWTGEHTLITNAFSELLTGAYNAGNILQFEGVPAATAAQARFLRAFYYYHVLDNWGKFPHREPGTSLLVPPVTMEAEAGTNFLIAELEAVLSALPDGTPVNAGKANKNAARMLLSKLYLNRGTFKDRSNPTFPEADMDKVIEYTTDIIESGAYSLSENYYDNFTPDNSTASTENIFVTVSNKGVPQAFGNGIQSRWFATLNYDQAPGGWNGFATLGDFYDKFEDADMRKKYDDPVAKAGGGFNMGFLIGQQYKPNGDPINGLIFTKEVSLIEKGANLKVTGIRVVKYRPDFDTPWQPGNDYVHYRYSDALLMKAEALLRTGDNGGALALVNEVRAARIDPANPLGSLTLQALLDERGRELYWEGHRRNDLVRFGQFLSARPTKGDESDPKYLVYPIPLSQLAVNPNLSQNEGY